MSDSLMVMKLLHDMKSPLTALRILEQKVALEPEQRKLFAQTLSFIDSLITGAKKNESMSGKDLEIIVQNIVREKRFIHGDGSVSLRVYGFEKTEDLHGCGLDLRRILSNLLENAIAASERSENKPSVDLWVILDGSKTRIICRDFACGLPSEYMGEPPESGFGPTESGWGLGLRIVRDICARNKWSLQLLSQKPEGTCATLHLR